METIKVSKKELELIVEALNWADQTMRDFDAKTDRKADQMAQLVEKLTVSFIV